MKDIEFCNSSFLSFRYICEENKDYFDNKHHKNIKRLNDDKRIMVSSPKDIEKEIKRQIEKFKGLKKGILLSGGMDSAIIASYLPGSEAYTFRFLGGVIQKEELRRAEYYAKQYHLNLHYVDIDWDNTVRKYLDPVIKNKNAPVHSIEPQIYQAAMQAKKDGCEIIFIGESSDLIFGGMDQLLSKDWALDEFKKRYTFVDPNKVLKKPISLDYVFEKYRIEKGKIDFLRFMDEIFSIESSSSYLNAFNAAKIDYYDPYACLKMANPLDLNKVRNGESKYLIRELFKKRYPGILIPEKIPMPRPVDEYFRKWKGPKRPEFIKNLDMSKFTGNQKWLIWCLEYFLNNLDKKSL